MCRYFPHLCLHTELNWILPYYLFIYKYVRPQSFVNTILGYKIGFKVVTTYIFSVSCVRAKLLQLCLTPYDSMYGGPPGSSVHGDSLGKNTGVGCHALLQKIFPAQGSNPGLLHCRWILYWLSHQGSPRILEWVAYPYCRDLLNLGTELGSPALQVDSLSAELPVKPSHPVHKCNSKF